MRNLTIKRIKSFVGCLAKLKIYIEDPSSEEITINNVACRKIGEIKNGEEKTFQVEERAAKVYVIADRLSKDYCNEYYQLPAGQEDVSLSGKNRFNPANGNAFRFDNNENEAAAANRSRGTRKGLIVLIISIAVGIVVGFLISNALFSNRAPKAKTFSDEGLSVTLTDSFKRIQDENYTVAYTSKDVALMATKIPFSAADGIEDIVLEDYLDIVIKDISSIASNIKKITENGLYGLEFDIKTDTDNPFHWFTYAYKSHDSFWIIQFTANQKDAVKYAEDITSWAKSVTFYK